MLILKESKFKKILAIILCVSFAAMSVGCGGKDLGSIDLPASDVSSDTNVSMDSASSDEANLSDAGVSDNSDNTGTEGTVSEDSSEPIVDFDEYINGKWVEEQRQNKSDEDNVSALSELDVVIDGRLHEILETTDLNSLSNDDGLYKVISFYNELCFNDPSTRIESIKRIIQPIAEADSLDKLHSLYCDERYQVFDSLFRFKALPDSNGYNTLRYSPERITLNNGDITLEKISAVDGNEAFYDFFSCLGFSEDRVMEMIKNAGIIDSKIAEFSSETAQSPSLIYITEDIFEEMGGEAPVFEILAKTDSFGDDYVFLAINGCADFFNEIYKEENAEELRDYLLICAILKLSLVSGDEKLLNTLGSSNEDMAFNFVKTFGGDVLNDEFLRRYIDESTLKTVINLETDIKRTAGSLVNKTEWLDNTGKSKAREKVQGMREYFGARGDDGNDLSDLVLSGDCVEDLILIYQSQKHYYRSQLDKEDTERIDFRNNLLESNAWFYSQYNLLTVSTGLISNPLCDEDVPYERRLGYIGVIIAHEVSHSYDPSGISYDRDGYYGPWLSEAQRTEYLSRVQSIADYFDNMEVEYGIVLYGNKVVNETFADIMAMQICLKILEKQDDPDYDMFFRSYAESKASYNTKDGVEYIVNYGYLPGKQRINCVLGQFDKFYETYDIDENSPYYVPADKRIKVF